MSKHTFDCGGCGHETTGYTRSDLETQGWVWHLIDNAQAFILCDSCEALYANRRADSLIESAAA